MKNLNYQLAFLKLPVSDITRAAAFYRDALQFKEEFVAPQFGWAQLSANNLDLALYIPGMGGGNAKIGASAGFQLSLPPDQFSTLAADLINRGVVIDNKIQIGTDETIFIHVQDPDGNIIHITSALP
jgi:predicted enzyme related to lactoylglutathione lyase